MVLPERRKRIEDLWEKLPLSAQFKTAAEIRQHFVLEVPTVDYSIAAALFKRHRRFWKSVGKLFAQEAEERSANKSELVFQDVEKKIPVEVIKTYGNSSPEDKGFTGSFVYNPKAFTGEELAKAKEAEQLPNWID